MNLREINQIYNGFEVKDMPRQEFVKKMQELTSQSGVQRDLGVIMGTKQTQAITELRNRQKINRAIVNGPSRRN